MINSRYAAYASEQGRTADEQMKHDRNMAGYMAWVSHKKRAFCKAHPEHFTQGGSITNHDAFDAFLGGAA